jgi:glycosyltransferase involved in cell wall biosynthesis
VPLKPAAPACLPLELSVILPAHNPDPGRLDRTLAGLRAQTLPAGRWEILVVDNGSRDPLDESALARRSSANLRLVREPRLGLAWARRRGFGEARSPLCVLVDDDNVLAPDYLAHVIRHFESHPEIGALGGKVLPEFARQPEGWQREFLPLLALRDLGPEPIRSRGLRPAGAVANQYPVEAAPIGAGMAIRLEAARQWMDRSDGSVSDRRGSELTSGGDNEIVLILLRQGWEVGYFPDLTLLHLIPASRLEARYLARLNYGIQRSWVQVLLRHDASPWPAIPSWTVPLRQAKACLTYRAWAGSAAFIRWRGACGHFRGRSFGGGPAA